MDILVFALKDRTMSNQKIIHMNVNGHNVGITKIGEGVDNINGKKRMKDMSAAEVMLFRHFNTKADPSKSIHPRKRGFKARENRAKNHAKNRTIRANLYSTMDGETGTKRASEWHSTLDALSMGTA